jgi:hypothetical protein
MKWCCSDKFPEVVNRHFMNLFQCMSLHTLCNDVFFATMSVTSRKRIVFSLSYCTVFMYVIWIMQCSVTIKVKISRLLKL